MQAQLLSKHQDKQVAWFCSPPYTFFGETDCSLERHRRNLRISFFQTSIDAPSIHDHLRPLLTHSIPPLWSPTATDQILTSKLSRIPTTITNVDPRILPTMKIWTNHSDLKSSVACGGPPQSTFTSSSTIPLSSCRTAASSNHTPEFVTTRLLHEWFW